MNLKAKVDLMGRFDEILLCHDSMVKYLNKNQHINVQLVDFSPNGSYVAIALRSGLLLIMDFLTMGIVRVFSSQEDFGLAANEDIDQFYPFWKAVTYFDDDFVFKQKPMETTKGCEDFLQEKYACRRSKDPDCELPKRIQLNENKQGNMTKTSVVSICWGKNETGSQSVNTEYIGAGFKSRTTPTTQQTSGGNNSNNNNAAIIKNYICVWNYRTCELVSTLDLGSGLNFNQFELKVGADGQLTVLISGDQAMRVTLDKKLINVEDCDKKVFSALENQQNGGMPEQGPSGKSRKGPVQKSFNQIALLLQPETYLLVSNTQKSLYIVREKGKKYQFQKKYDDSYISDQFDLLSKCDIGYRTDSIVLQAQIDASKAKLLLNFQDRNLRHFSIDPQTFEIKFLEATVDFINHHRWLQCAFFDLPPVTKIVNESSNDYRINVQLTTDTLFNSYQFANSSPSMFMASSGNDFNADTLHFYNGEYPFAKIKEINWANEGCSCFSVHSGSHFSVVLASTTGSLMVWQPKPAKLIQPLAHKFVEIEDNVVYVEKEDEFEEEDSGNEGSMAVEVPGLEPLTKRQMKLMEPIDFGDNDDNDNDSDSDSNNNADQDKKSIQVAVHADDSFAVLARMHQNQLRHKFNSLLPQGNNNMNAQNSQAQAQQQKGSNANQGQDEMFAAK